MKQQDTTRPSDWVETTLGEVVEIQPGFAFKSKDFETNQGFPVVKIKNIQPPIIRVAKEDKVNISEYSLEKLEKFKVKKGEYLIAMTGETIGKVGKYNLQNFAYINQRVCKIVKTEKSDYNFIYYTLLQDLFQKFINTHSFGAAQANISTDQIGKYKILLPPLSEQKAIASVLSSFDDKIELLREQNKTLEEIGQTIFKEWFGKYGVDDLPAEDSAQAGELPEGWRVGKLGEICSLKSGFAFSGNDFVEESNTMVLKIKDLKGDGIVDLSDISFVKDEIKDLERVQYFKLKSGDIVLAMSGNTTGKIGIIPHLEGELFLNQRVGKIFIDEEIYKTFIYFFLMSGSYQEKILAMGYGSAQPNINPTQIENIDIIYPNNKILENFVNTTNPIFTKILDNLYQIQSLVRSRDELLPKLTSGQVRVNFI
jgi:type I restriction enzyme S subunit